MISKKETLEETFDNDRKLILNKKHYSCIKFLGIVIYKTHYTFKADIIKEEKANLGLRK